MNPRSIQDGPFLWMGKFDLRRIADACDSRADRAHVFAVYLALAWFASDRQSETFSETKSKIAERAGLSYRKTSDVLNLLARLGVVGVSESFIHGTKERGPNTYTLGTACLRSSTPCLRLGTASNSDLPRLVEESLEESLEHLAPNGAKGGAKPDKQTTKPSKPRERNPLLDALVALDGTDPTQATPPAWGKAVKALADIRTVSPDVTAAEIQRRATNYRLHYTTAAISPTALSGHWGLCNTAPNQAPSRPEASVRRIDLSAS